MVTTPVLDQITLVDMHEDRRDLPWTVALSPVQLGLAGDPWRVLVACILLNRTRGVIARPAVARALRLWPTPAALALAPLRAITAAVRPLGLQRSRARNLRNLARVWVTGDWEHARDLPGVGPYALDALQIFCLDDLSVEPTDVVLRDYVHRMRMT